jgi:hypothetical protein
MFPYPKDPPTVSGQSTIGISISRYVLRYFVSPKLGITLRPSTMQLAAVPETTIYENCNLLTYEGNVDSATSFGNSGILDAESAPLLMQRGPYAAL